MGFARSGKYRVLATDLNLLIYLPTADTAGMAEMDAATADTTGKQTILN